MIIFFLNVTEELVIKVFTSERDLKIQIHNTHSDIA